VNLFVFSMSSSFFLWNIKSSSSEKESDSEEESSDEDEQSAAKGKVMYNQLRPIISNLPWFK